MVAQFEQLHAQVTPCRRFIEVTPEEAGQTLARIGLAGQRQIVEQRLRFLRDDLDGRIIQFNLRTAEQGECQHRHRLIQWLQQGQQDSDQRANNADSTLLDYSGRHELRVTSHVSRITFHVSRITYHVSRITFHGLVLITCSLL